MAPDSASSLQRIQHLLRDGCHTAAGCDTSVSSASGCSDLGACDEVAEAADRSAEIRELQAMLSDAAAEIQRERAVSAELRRMLERGAAQDACTQTADEPLPPASPLSPPPSPPPDRPQPKKAKRVSIARPPASPTRRNTAAESPSSEERRAVMQKLRRTFDPPPHARMGKLVAGAVQELRATLKAKGVDLPLQRCANGNDCCYTLGTKRVNLMVVGGKLVARQGGGVNYKCTDVLDYLTKQSLRGVVR
eukprot:TRINITY_DN11686_c5_g1_i1.p1 TRINITY_DN11686_c5_g1~~TRINITY_DN11686_c5_g1_i1.p1  ORF type:complete len:249 (+),score=60.68 TRINITY_DN11686_c5_g1_i1:71-817(+)